MFGRIGNLVCSFSHGKSSANGSDGDQVQGSVLGGSRWAEILAICLLGLSGHITEAFDDFFSLDLVSLVTTFSTPPSPSPLHLYCI